MAFVVYLCIALCTAVLGQGPVSRLCADQECKEPISEAVVMLRYVPDADYKIHASRTDVVTVYSKGSESNLWEVELNGKRGYFPSSHLQERKTFKKTEDLVKVSTENKSAETQNLDENLANTLLDKNVPDSELISESFSVVAGTTFYSDTPESTVETEPMQTAYTASTVEKPLTYQFAKTIDATSISNNKLDEPNDSLILPQPTTSSDVNYRESSQTVTPELPELEDVHKSEGLKVSDASADSIKSSSGTESEEMGNADAGDVDRSQTDETETVESKEEEEEYDGEEEEEEQEEDGEDDDEEEEEVVEVSRELDDTLEVGLDSRERSEEKSVMEEDHASNNESSSERNVSLENSASPSPPDASSEDLSVEENTTGELKESVTSTATEKLPTVSVPVSVDEKIEQNVVEQFNMLETENGAVQTEDTSGGNVNDQGLEEKDSQGEIENQDQQDESHSASESLQENDLGQITENLEAVNSEVHSQSNINVKLEEQFSEGEGQKDDLLGESVEKDNSSEVQDWKQESITSTSDSVSPSVDSSNMKQQSDGSESTTSGESVETITDDEIGLISGSSAEETIENVPALEDDASEEYADEVNKEQSVNTFSLGNFFSTLYGNVVSYVIGSPKTESETFDESDITEHETSQKDGNISPEEILGTCKAHTPGCEPESGSLPVQQLADSQVEWLSSQDSERPNNMDKSSFGTFFYLIVTAVTVLIFSLGHYYIEKKRRDGSLIAKINTLEKKLIVYSQEKFELRDRLEELTAHKPSSDAITGDSDILLELQECKAARIELEEQVLSLEKELEAATEAGLELNRMMSELLSAQHGSDTLMKSVEHLQKQLDSQQGTISTMNACLTAKDLENETLQSELNLALEQINTLKEQLENSLQAVTKTEKEKTDMEQSLLVKNQAIEQKLVEALESKSADSQRLCRELDTLQDVLDETRKTLLSREGEVAVLRDILNNSDSLAGSDHKGMSLDDLLEVGRLRANIELITQERENLKERVRGEEDARKLLEDHVKIVSEEVSTLRVKYEEAEREKTEAQTRLEVLSNYFKEKETQLQKELGLQEAMCLQKEGDVLSTIERIKLFQEETESYKAQNELLKKEILDQERSMKAQIVALEKKVHENWVAARQAERRLEESKQEASQLRNRLTLKGRRVVGTMPGPDVKLERDVEHNGEVPSSPALLNEAQDIPSSPLHYGLPASPPLLPPSGQPLPPGPFPPGMPPPPMFLTGASGLPPFPMPPPGSFFSDDLRPPPLGRMSSPPPEPRGSFSPYDHSPPRSPPNRPYRSPIQYDDSPSRFRQQTPPSSGAPSFSGPYLPAKWDDRGGPPRSSFRPLYRDSPQEPKERGRGARGRQNSEAGSALSSGHSSDSLEKGGRHSNRV